MAPSKTQTRSWYVAIAAIAMPWWLLNPPLFLYFFGYLVALAVAAAATPRVTFRARAAGLTLVLPLTCLIWVAVMFYVGGRYGDAEWQSETNSRSTATQS